MDPLQVKRYNLIDEGVTIGGRQFVENVPYNMDAGNDFQIAMDMFQSSAKYGHPAPMPFPLLELTVPSNVEPYEVAKIYGRAFVDEYGSDFAIIDSAKAVSSNEATDKAINKLKSVKRSGLLGQVIVVEHDLSESQANRYNRLAIEFGKLTVPVISIVPLELAIQRASSAKQRSAEELGQGLDSTTQSS